MIDQLLSWDLSHPDLQDDPKRSAKVPLPDEPNMQKEVEVGFLCDREARCGDETTYLMSMLQNKLDRTKVKNHFKLAELSTKIEQSLAYEDALFF